MEENSTQNQTRPVNTDEIKEIKKPSRNYLKISLPLAGMFVLLGVVSLTVNSVMQQQSTQSRASISSSTLTPIHDTYVSRNSPSANNKSSSVLTAEGVDEGKYIFMKYSLAGIPAGSTVSKVELKMRTAYANGSNSSHIYKVVLLNSASYGNDITYSSMPSLSGSSVGTIASPNQGSWNATLLNASAFNSKVGSTIALAIYDTSKEDAATYDSSETSNDPQLIITYSTPVSPTNAPTVTKAPTSAPTNTPTPTPGGPVSVTVNKLSYAPGENVTVTWANIPNATPRDWIGLYTPTAANGSEIGWIYVNCTQAATTVVVSGTCTFPLPAAAPLGTLELRLHPNDGNTVLAKSQLFNLVNGPTVTAGPTATTVPTATTAPSGTATPTVASTPTASATPTLIPGNTYLAVNLMLHGLGKGGDAVNPNGTGNMNPLRTQRTVTVDIFDVQNQLVLTKQGTVTYNATTGGFAGSIELDEGFTTGLYTVKIKTEQYLRGLVAGIQTITNSQVTNLPSLTLVSGDVNNDNAINIVDYNILVGCYSDLLAPVSCTAANLLRADLNDDGKVNQFDYNLFIREMANLGGQ